MALCIVALRMCRAGQNVYRKQRKEERPAGEDEHVVLQEEAEGEPKPRPCVYKGGAN